MRFIVMFITAVCVLFLLKLRWPMTKSTQAVLKFIVNYFKQEYPQLRVYGDAWPLLGFTCKTYAPRIERRETTTKIEAGR